MKWLKDVAIELAKKCTPKAASVLLGILIVGVIGYFITDRYFDYKEATLVKSSPSSVENVSPEKYATRNINKEVKNANILQMTPEPNTNIKKVKRPSK